MSKENETVALQATIGGRVQGVGFRFFVQSHAERLNLGGWVRNAPDGQTVELYVEGSRSSVEELLKVSSEGPPGSHVEQVDSEWTQPQGMAQTFEIRR